MKRITLIDKAFLLKRTLLFATLDLDLLLTIADKLGIATFDTGDIIFNVNQDVHRMYFIVKGAVQIRDRHHRLIATLEADDFFGEESLFNDKPRAYEAICTQETSLLTLSRTNLLTIISECPSVAVGFLQVYSSAMPIRLRKSSEGE